MSSKQTEGPQHFSPHQLPQPFFLFPFIPNLSLIRIKDYFLSNSKPPKSYYPHPSTVFPAPAQDLLNFKDQELHNLQEKHKNLEFEFKKLQDMKEIAGLEEKIQVLSREVNRLTDLSYAQKQEVSRCSEENEGLKRESDLKGAKIKGLELENAELRAENERISLEKRSVEVQKVFIQDNAEFNEKIKAITIELGDVSAKLNEKTLEVKRLELEKTEIVKTNEKIFGEVEHWKKETLKFETEIKEILILLRGREIEIEDFRAKLSHQGHFYEERLTAMFEELLHWKSSYEYLFYQELPRLNEALMSQPPPPMLISSPPVPMMVPPPQIHKSRKDQEETNEELHRHCHEKSKELKKIIESLKEELHEKSIYIENFQEKIQILQREIKELRGVEPHRDLNLEKIISEKDQEIRSLRIQLDEKIGIIASLKSQISSAHTNIHISGVTSASGLSAEAFKIEVVKLQKILQEKNEEIQSLKLQVDSYLKRIKVTSHNNDERVLLLEKELELWKARFSENMTINMHVKKEAALHSVSHVSQPAVYENKIIRESNSGSIYKDLERPSKYRVEVSRESHIKADPNKAREIDDFLVKSREGYRDYGFRSYETHFPNEEVQDYGGNFRDSRAEEVRTDFENNRAFEFRNLQESDEEKREYSKKGKIFGTKHKEYIKVEDHLGMTKGTRDKFEKMEGKIDKKEKKIDSLHLSNLRKTGDEGKKNLLKNPSV